MKRQIAEGLSRVPESQISSLASAIAPESANRLPENITGWLPELRFIAKTERMPQWQAAIALDDKDNAYPVSPRALKGYAWIGKKLTKYDDANCIKVSVVDFLKANTPLKVTYSAVEIDDFGKDLPVTRDLPYFRLAGAVVEPVKTVKPPRVRNNAPVPPTTPTNP